MPCNYSAPVPSAGAGAEDLRYAVNLLISRIENPYGIWQLENQTGRQNRNMSRYRKTKARARWCWSGMWSRLSHPPGTKWCCLTMITHRWSLWWRSFSSFSCAQDPKQYKLCSRCMWKAGVCAGCTREISLQPRRIWYARLRKRQVTRYSVYASLYTEHEGSTVCLSREQTGGGGKPEEKQVWGVGIQSAMENISKQVISRNQERVR